MSQMGFWCRKEPNRRAAWGNFLERDSVVWPRVVLVFGAWTLIGVVCRAFCLKARDVSPHRTCLLFGELEEDEEGGVESGDGVESGWISPRGRLAGGFWRSSHEQNWVGK